MPEFYKIKDHLDLIKHTGSKAVLNVDQSALNKYREERDRLLRLSQVADKTRDLEKDVTEIKQTLSEILDLLRNKA